MEFWWEENGIRRTCPLRQGSSIIGRDPSCTIVLPGKNVSKKHVQCLVENGSVTIRDLGSSNGTFVNGDHVESCVLQDGDQLRLGSFSLTLNTAGEPAAELTAEPITISENTDFQKEPGPDDTPADGSFVPQAYVPPELLQPQVIARDGRMYLRDPRTNREVEIVPRGKAAASGDVSGYYSEQEAGSKRKNLYLIIGAALLAVFMIVAIIKSGGTDKHIQAPAFPLADYNALIDKAIESINESKANAAVDALSQAVDLAKDYPNYNAAANLLPIAKTWQKSGKPADEFDWSLLIRELADLRQSNNEKVQSFAAKQSGKAIAIQTDKAAADAARAEKDPVAAFKKFQEIPKNSPLWNVSKDLEGLVEKARTASLDKYLKEAQAAISAREWQQASILYNKTIPAYIAKPEEEHALSACRKYLQQCQDQAALVRDIQFLIIAGTLPSLDEAAKKLEQVTPNGFFGADVPKLKSDIAAKRTEVIRAAHVEEAKDLYRRGQGEDAIAVITANSLSELDAIRKKVPKLNAAIAEAEAARAEKDYDAERAAWKKLQTVETDTENEYYKRAERRLQQFNDPEIAGKLAEEYDSRARDAFQKDDVGTARQLFLKAVEWDPGHKIGKPGLDDLQRQAVITYNKAMELKLSGSLSPARSLFEKVLLMTDPENDYHKRAQKWIAEIDLDPSQKK